VRTLRATSHPTHRHRRGILDPARSVPCCTRCTSFEICCSRCEIAHPCCGSFATHRKINKSKVPSGNSNPPRHSDSPLHFDSDHTRLLSKCKGSPTPRVVQCVPMSRDRLEMSSGAFRLVSSLRNACGLGVGSDRKARPSVVAKHPLRGFHRLRLRFPVDQISRAKSAHFNGNSQRLAVHWRR
jgi:hypothetical protein